MSGGRADLPAACCGVKPDGVMHLPAVRRDENGAKPRPAAGAPVHRRCNRQKTVAPQNGVVGRFRGFRPRSVERTIEKPEGRPL